MGFVGWLVSDGVALTTGIVAGLRWAAAKQSGSNKAGHAQWRAEFAALNAFLLSRGYEPEVTDGEYLIEAPGPRFVLRVPIAHLDPGALQADLCDLPPAREWSARRRPPKGAAR